VGFQVVLLTLGIAVTVGILLASPWLLRLQPTTGGR
jgi:hypothetical protein